MKICHYIKNTVIVRHYLKNCFQYLLNILLPIDKDTILSPLSFGEGPGMRLCT